MLVLVHSAVNGIKNGEVLAIPVERAALFESNQTVESKRFIARLKQLAAAFGMLSITID
jgi:hypothetical protein